MRQLVVLIVAVASATALFAQGAPRLARPRVEPLAESAWGDRERALVASFGQSGRAANDLKTFLRHPEMVEGIMPFVRYVSTASTLSPRDRELLILRTAWLCRAEYLWAQHVPVARQAGLTAAEIHRVAEGPDAVGWAPADAVLLRAADELRTDDFIVDATWRALAARYDREHLLDAVLTVGEEMLMAVVTNSLGVQPDAGLTDRLPGDVPYRIPPPMMPSAHVELTVPRVPPMTLAEMTPAMRAMVDPTNAGRAPSNLFGTYAWHASMYAPREDQSEYIRQHLSITAHTREMGILRMTWLSRGDVAWSTHAGGARRTKLLTDEEITAIGRGAADPVWGNVDAALLRAADEMRTEDMIRDATWNTLAKHYTVPQLIDVMVSAVGYRIVSMFGSTFGVQREAGNAAFPWQ